MTVGTSVEGRTIVASRLGTPGGTKVMAVGSIHGNEQAGIEIAEHLRDHAAIPAGIDLWVITTVNPDGNVDGTRTNARRVDLNRNFPTHWEEIDCAAFPRFCSGPAPASDTETQAVVGFVDSVRPELTVWYHGADTVVDDASVYGVASPTVLQGYASRTGYPIATVPCGPSGTCTGNATQYMNATIGGSSAFVVELSTSRAGGMSTTGVANHVSGLFAAADAA